MKKSIFSISRLFLSICMFGVLTTLFVAQGYSQCLHSAQYGGGVAPASAGQTITLAGGIWAGEYSAITGVAATTTYVSNSTGGTGNYITIRQSTYDGTVIAHGPAPLTWTSTVAGDYFQHISLNAACGTENVGRTSTITKEACTNTIAYGSGAAPAPGATTTLTTCAYASEYSTITGVAATTNYISSSSISTDFITIRQGTYNGTLIAAGYSPLVWTSTVAGDYFQHINTNDNCGTQSLCRSSLIRQPATTCDYNVPFTGNNSITVNSGAICDHAGWGTNYANNANGYTVINPVNAGDMVVLLFTHFHLENCCDYVNVYDGIGTAGTLLFSGYGTTIPPIQTSTSGPLTLEFTSDGSVVLPGFRAEISNIPAPCVTPGSPASPTGLAIGYNAATLSWLNGTPVGSPIVSYDYEVIRSSDLVVVATGSAPSTTVGVAGLECSTSYHFRVRATTSCNGTQSAWSAISADFTTDAITNPTNVTATPATICNGDFSDLNATSAGNVIHWYTDPVGGTAIGTSDSNDDFTVYPTSTTTYYAEAQQETTGSLFTTNAGGSGCGAGIMFDITADATTIAINAFDIIPNNTGIQNVNVYYKAGTFTGFETNAAAWTLLGTYSINGTVGVGVNMPISNIVIPQSETYGIYLNFDAQYTSLGSFTDYTNSDITLRSGYGHCSLFDGCCSPRGFNGTVHYTKGNITQYVGPANASFGTADPQTFTVQHLIFDVLSTTGVTIQEVDAYFTSPIGSAFTITLNNSIGTVLETYSDVVAVTGGPAQTIPINFNVPQGTNYSLRYSLNPGSLRHSSGAVYPYSIPSLSITGNSWDINFYYWFYNWKVQTNASCVSGREPVTVTVNDVPAQPSVIAGNDAPCEGTSQIYSVTDVLGVTYNWSFPSGWNQTAGGTTYEATADVGITGGNITVTPENSCGLGTPSTLPVIVNALPVVSISGLNTFYCEYNSPAIMTGNPTGGTFSGPGVTGNEFSPAAAGVGTWSVVYTYTDGNGCTNDETIIVDVDVCTSIGTVESGTLSVYPNPVTDMFTIEVNALIDSDFQWTLVDVKGKMIMSGSESLLSGQNFITIETEHLASGMYMLHSSINGEMIHTKIIKNR
jgi:hypothetical protein